MGNRFSSIALGNKDTADRRPGPGPIGSTRPGPIRATRSSKHRASPYPRQSPKRAALERSGSSPSHAITASSSSSSAHVTRFRDDSPDTDSSNSDLEEGWDNPTTLSAPTRDSGAPLPSGPHCYTAFPHMPIRSPTSFMSLPLILRPIPSLPRHLDSTHTSVHVQIQAQTTSLPGPRTRISRESSPDYDPDYEVLNPNTQGQAVWESEDEASPPGSHGGAMTKTSEEAGLPRKIPSVQVIARSISQGSGSTSEAGHMPPRFAKPVSAFGSTTGQGKIPKPPGEPGRPSSGGYNLQEATQLEPSRFRTVRVSMNNLVKNHLDTGRTFTKQTEERVAVYTEEALRLFPFLEDYEDRWPIRAFAVMHLHYLQNQRRGRSRDMH
ncbi:hypothetical protein EV121DRAFT_191302 [Schizophyllum commune]